MPPKEGCLIVAPHPDDETIGAGIWMTRHRNRAITVLHITDGSPRDGADALAAGFQSSAAYASARRAEVQEALRLAGDIQSLRFGYTDKETHDHLPELIERIGELADELRPAVVLSPAYEGGHPDHDSAAFAVAAAALKTPGRFLHREYALYHAGPAGEFLTEEFLPAATHVEVCPLSLREQDRKRKMFEAFKTQRHVLRQFPIRAELFRDAPQYDFARPPHAGPLLYESWNWAITGVEWRRSAAEALSQTAGHIFQTL